MADLFDILVRHQIYLEGLKAGRSSDFPQVLGKLDYELRKQLSLIQYENLGEANKTELNKLLVALRAAMRSVFNPWLRSLVVWLERFVVVETEMFGTYYETESDPGQIFAASKTDPMGANGLFWVPFLNGSALYAMTRLERLVTNGYANRLTKTEIINGFLGTKSRGYKDGIGRQLDNATTAAIATVMQHLSAQTNMTLAKKVFGSYEWVSVLDDATTDICRSRDGNIYPYGKGPIPPAHVRCRSIIVPNYSRAATPDLRFNMWANRQPADFVNDAFDGGVPARYEGSDPLSLEQYRGKRRFILA